MQVVLYGVAFVLVCAAASLGRWMRFNWFIRKNALLSFRLRLEQDYGQVWTLSEMRREFKATDVWNAREKAEKCGTFNDGTGFLFVTRRRDGLEGTLTFIDNPGRFYYHFSGDMENWRHPPDTWMDGPLDEET